MPKNARWENILKLKQDVGNQLNKALSSLEEVNPELEGVLRHIDFNATKGRTKLKDQQLVDLIHHFNKYRLRNEDFEFPDLLGAAYEYLLKEFADSAGKKGGEFYTPTQVKTLMVRLVKPREGMTIYDPTVGSGGFLIESYQYVEATGQNPRNLGLYGQELNGVTWSICKMNMILHGIPDAHIENEDTLTNPRSVEGGYIKQFDRVLANPPFSQNYTRVNMQFPQRFKYGFTPETGKKADLMFLQHMIASLKSNGMMATVMPHGVLFRGGQEKVIREGIIKDDLIEAIIGLPPKLFYNTGIPACIVVINKAKPSDFKNKILFINADREYGEGRNQNYLRPEDIEKIVTVFEKKLEIPKYSRIVDVEEIEQNDYNLNIRRYVDNSPDPEIESVYHHLHGCVPTEEIELYKGHMEKFNFKHYTLFVEKDAKSLDFKETIDDKNKIKDIVEQHEGVKNVYSVYFEKLDEWWREVLKDIQAFYGNNNIWKFREKALESLKQKLLPLGVFDDFKIAGIFVNWWEELKYDFKTIVSSGWSKKLIDDERLISKFFDRELKEIEEVEGEITEVEGELNEILEEIEDWDEEEQGDKTVKKVKDYIKGVIKDLRVSFTNEAIDEAYKWEDLLKRIEDKEKELKKLNRELNSKKKVLEDAVKEKREMLTEAEARELILEKFKEVMDGYLEKYLSAEKKELIKIFENLWDKYKISLEQLTKERDEEIKKLNDFLTKLGCYYD